ncbi:MAG: hypothetical protein LBR80_02015 [Deltaproteobacteria bacterium]|jgi:hypothetical protein|nr:hypothetical protein [Deltaproteobacteria bacterium]
MGDLYRVTFLDYVIPGSDNDDEDGHEYERRDDDMSFSRIWDNISPFIHDDDGE